MTTENTLMTEQAANPNEGQAASTEAVTEAVTTTPEATATQQAEGQEATTEAKAKVEGAPEKYEFVMPEKASMDEAGLTAFGDFAKSQNLSQEAAQKLLDAMAPAAAARQQEQIEAVKSQWVESSKSDKEIGGDKLNENMAIAKKALDQFGTPELRDLLNESGLGNHPEIIRAFYRAGKAISEDGFVAGRTTNANTNDPAKRLFPNQA